MSNPSKRMIFRSVLLMTASATLTAPVLAHAQAATQAAAPTEVVVTGVRASNQKAVKIKKASDQILDTVSASEIGQLPDFNAGDALKRVTGVNALLYQGEPRFVIARGFDENYNDTLIDGFTLASTDVNQGTTNLGGRQISMEVLPSNLASHIDVLKAASPATEGNFVGGLVDFVTPSAFDFRKGTVSVAVRGGETLSSQNYGGDHFTGEAQLSTAQRFGDHDQFGLYLSATYWSRQVNVPQEETGGTRNWYTSTGALTTPYGGTGFAVPSQRLYYNYQDSRERAGLQARFDWRPNANFSAYVNAYDFHQEEQADRNDLNAAVQSAAQDLNQTATTGTLTNVTQTIQLGRLRWNRDVAGVYGRFSEALGGGWKLDGGMSWSQSSVWNPQTWDNFAQSKMAFNYNTGGASPTFTAVNPTNAANDALYALVYHREELYTLGEDRYDGQLNLTYNSEKDDRGLGLAFGARSNTTEQAVSFSRLSYSGNAYTLANVVSGQTLCGYQCDTPITLIDPALANGEFAQNKAHLTVTEDFASEAGGTYHVNETVNALYAQAQYRWDHVFILGGFRYEGTIDGSSSTEAVNGVYQPVEAHKDYGNLLPSILGVIDTGDSSKLKLSFSETLSRPTFGAFALHGGVLNTTTAPDTLSTGNPNLKPRQSDNFDISHEWYLDKGKGLLSVALFEKTIRDDIFTYGQAQTLSVNGVATPVLVTEAQNSRFKVHASGVELGFSHDLDMLPSPFDGFGVSANATLSTAKFPIILSDGVTVVQMKNLPEQAPRIYNASIYYDKDRWHGRLAWNHLGQLWDDRFPNFTPSGFYANRYQAATNNVDFQASYDVNRHISLSVDALNLTAQGMKYHYGVSQALLQSEWKLPTEIMFGVKFKN